MNWLRESVRSVVGPQAKAMWRRLKLCSVNVSGSGIAGRLIHQTLSPLASTSLICTSLVWLLPLICVVSAKSAGQASGSSRRSTA